MKSIGLITIIFSFLTITVSNAQNYDSILESIEINKTSNVDLAKESIALLEANYNKLSLEQKELTIFFKGHALALEGKFDDSTQQLEELIRSSKYETLVTRSHALVSNIYLFAGDYEQAYQHASDATDGLESMDYHPWHKYAALQNLTSLYRQSGMTNTAIGYARQMLKVVSQNKHPLQLCGSYFELADLELSIKNVDMARIHSEEAMLHCTEANDPIYYTLALDLQTKLMAQSNKSDKALELLKEHYPVVMSVDYKTMTNVFEIRLASTYLELKDFTNAKNIAELAYHRAEELNDKVRLMELSQILASVYSETGELKKAVEYYHQYIQLEKEIDIMTNKRKMAYYLVSRRK
ncbi:tetratricopeptide repeat protein [Kangiella sp.]|uniref:tetratricopeptide repeat protein n=1 Tax=Kangiella sp. TaxID=1920245 RepID=UPI003A923B37